MAESKNDILESANHMIEHYGADAEKASTSYADACLAEGDMDGSIKWTRVKLLVAEITAGNEESQLH